MAVSSVGEGPQGVAQVQLAVVACLRKGLAAVQRQQAKGRRKEGNQGSGGGGGGGGVAEQGEREQGGLTQWTMTCLNVLATLVPRLIRGEQRERGRGSERGSERHISTSISTSGSTSTSGPRTVSASAPDEGTAGVTYRIQVSASALALLEQVGQLTSLSLTSHFPSLTSHLPHRFALLPVIARCFGGICFSYSFIHSF